MKILILGIDSLGFNALEKLRLNFLKRLLNQGKVFNPKIDNNVGRGWPEIYTGKTSYETGAFYVIPMVVNNRIIKYSKTGLSYVLKHIPKDEILWHKINKLRLSFGIFNVNTVDMLEEINGFGVLGSFSAKLFVDLSKDVYPKHLLKDFRKKDIDIGFRLGYGAYLPKNEEDFKKKAIRHIEDTFELLDYIIKKNKVDVLFAQFPLIGELMFKFANLFYKESLNSYEKRLKNIVLNVCSLFEEKLESFLNFCSPKHLFLVSDHGSGPLEYHINLNEMLCKIGILKKKKTKSFAKKILTNFRNGLKNKNYIYIPCYNLEKSLAFSIGYTDVIYINDERFTGKFMSSKEVLKISDSIIKDLNELIKNTPLFGKIRFEVLDVPKYTETSYKTPLPNIRVYMHDTFFNSERTNGRIFYGNKTNFSEIMFKKGFYGEYGGWRAQDTIFGYIGRYDKEIEINNLIQVYNTIIKIAKKEV